MNDLTYCTTLSFDTKDGTLVVTVKELTVADIRQRLAGEVSEPAVPPMALDVALWGEDPLNPSLTPADVFSFSDLKEVDSERLTMTQRRALVKKIKEVNEDFFGLLGRWPGIVKELRSRADLLNASKTSSDQ